MIISFHTDTGTIDPQHQTYDLDRLCLMQFDSITIYRYQFEFHTLWNLYITLFKFVYILISLL